MDKQRIRKLFEEQTKRRKNIIKYASMLVVVTLLIVLFANIYVKTNRTEYVSYNENGSSDYKVYLRDNEFFTDKYLARDNQYISNIVDYIDTNFKYTLSMDEEDISYNYSYEVVASVNIISKTDKKVLYSYDENLVKLKKANAKGNKNVNVSQNVKVDYNKYNNMAKKFINTYELNDATAELSVKLNVTVSGSCEDVTKAGESKSVSYLTIPLNERTFSIDENSDITSSTSSMLACKNSNHFNYLLILLIIAGVGADIYLAFNLYKYLKSSKSAESIYNSELKKILNAYGSFIQKVNNNLNLGEYNVLRLDSFEDMLAVRDTIQEPILMMNSKYGKGTYFLIPSKTNILYSYSLNVNDIKRDMKLSKEEIL